MAIEETPDNVSPSGGVVKPIYSERHMRCLTVSESELKQIGLANIGVTIFASIGSSLLSFGVGLFKDATLTPSPDKTAEAMAQAIEHFCLWGGIVCFVVAGTLWFWRRDMIATIKRESGFK